MVTFLDITIKDSEFCYLLKDTDTNRLGNYLFPHIIGDDPKATFIMRQDSLRQLVKEHGGVYRKLQVIGNLELTLDGYVFPNLDFFDECNKRLKYPLLCERIEEELEFQTTEPIITIDDELRRLIVFNGYHISSVLKNRGFIYSAETRSYEHEDVSEDFIKKLLKYLDFSKVKYRLHRA